MDGYKLDMTERLVLAQTLYKLVAGSVKTGTPGNLRAALDAELLDAYRRDGSTQRALKLADLKVGTASVKAKGGWAVTDPAALDAWERACGFVEDREAVDWDALTDSQRASVEAFARSIAPQAVREVPVRVEDWTRAVSRAGKCAIDSDGCVVPGVEWREELSTVIRVDPAKVADAARTLPEAVTVADLVGDPSIVAALPGEVGA